MQDKKTGFAVALIALLTLGFLATSIVSYLVARNSLGDQITGETLPLTSDNIYSEIERDVLRSVLISSLMAQNTFLRDWIRAGEQDIASMLRYLSAVQATNRTTTSFFVSDRTGRYYHPTGILDTVDISDPGDAWYFRVRDLDSPYEINIDADTADRSRVSVFVNYRVVDADGTYLGATGVGLSLDAVTELIDQYEQRYGRRIYFANRQGDLTLHGSVAPEFLHLRDPEGPAAVATQILSSPGASLTYTAPSGERVYLNSRLLPELDWYLVVEQQGGAAGTRVLNALLLNILLALGITTVVLLTAYFTIRGYQSRLEDMATKDLLTGGANRQAFEAAFSYAQKRARRHDTPVSLLTVDIDHFKSINDRHGHAAGDAVMRALAELIRAQIRAGDLLCRWGGDELLVLLPDCALPAALGVAEAIREAVKQQPVHHDSQVLSYTISIGAAQYRPGENMDALVARCDTALYTSKTLGRDLVSSA